MSTDLAAIPYQLMDAEDEKQIAATMMGQIDLIKKVYVYQYKDKTGRTVTGLSNDGIKEAARHRGNIHIIDYKIERDGDKFVGTTIVRDMAANVDFIGIAEGDVNTKFGRIQAVSKSARNAYRGCIPAAIITGVIEKYLEMGEGVQIIYDPDEPAEPKVNSAKTVADYRLSPKKVEATPINPPKDTTSNPVVPPASLTPNNQPVTTPQKIVPPLQVMINKEKEQQAKKADGLKKGNKISNTSFTHTIPDSTGKLVPVTEEEYLAYCQMNQTNLSISTTTDYPTKGIIFHLTATGNYEKADIKENKTNPEFNRIYKLLLDCKDTSKKGIAIDGYWYFLDTHNEGIFIRTKSKFSKPEGTL